MATNAPPSRDPADDGSMLGTLQQVLKKFLQGVDGCLPARVLAYDRAANRAQVQPLVRVLTTDERQVSRAPIASVPVLALGGGDFVLSFPIQAGDLGWIVANDRDTSLYLQNLRESPPNSLRLHSFQDALFIPDLVRGFAIQGEDAANAVLQTRDGTARVAISAAGVKLTAGTRSLSITAAGHTFAGPVFMPDGATINGRTFLGHQHTGVQPGGGTSGGVA